MHAAGSYKDKLPGNSLTGTLFRWEENEIPRLVHVVKENVFTYILLHSEISGYHNFNIIFGILIYKFFIKANSNISMLHGIIDFKKRS